MGSIFAPNYAGLTVGYLEIKVYSICELKWGNIIASYIKENWYRFIDDCEIPLNKREIDPVEFLNILNSVNDKIQFTMETSETHISFLDIMIKRDDKIWMDLYQKPTDTQRYVPFSSNHPSHCKRNIPFTLARRICTIVENPHRKTKHLAELRENLLTQKYPPKLIDQGISKASSISQSELRKAASKKNKDHNIPFITTYNPNNPNISSDVLNIFNSLKTNCVPGFTDLNLIQCRKQAPNLKRILCKAAFSSKKTTIQKCGDKRCKCCEFLLLTDHYIFKNTGYKFVLKTCMSCNSSNLIYVIVCAGCSEEYIGETGEGDAKLRDRVRIYRQHIRDPVYQQLKVEEHIRSCGKGKFKIFPLLQMRTKDTNLRRAFETKFQNQFKTMLNKL